MTKLIRTHGALVALVAALAGCDDPPDDPPPPPPEPAQGIDLLVVVDNTVDMEDEQARLGAAIDRFVDGLAAELGTVPDLHIGVTSTDVGASGDVGVPSCTAFGDFGQLLRGARQSTCAADLGLEGRFISDVASPAGRVRNFTGELAPMFQCLVELGGNGCGFEQPLEAVRLATMPGNNLGFLRPDAALAILILTGEDDCSAAAEMFRDPDAGPDSALGPRVSFRCFEFGVRCDQANLRTVGEKTGCTASTSQYMPDVAALAEQVRQVKANGHVVVQVIAGPPSPVVVEPLEVAPSVLRLAESCRSSDAAGVPAIRLDGFRRAFGDDGFASICDPIDATLAAFGRRVAATQR